MKQKLPPEDADADAFARAMADVTPIAPDPRGRVRSRPPLTTPPLPQALPEQAAAATDERAHDDFAAPGIDRRTLRKLKRGDIRPTARLDLHGQTAAEASAALRRFLDTSGPLHRCVCIVHGRGLHSAGNVAVLKQLVRDQLRGHRAVLACTDAPPSDGGGGAVYVLLRKAGSA